MTVPRTRVLFSQSDIAQGVGRLAREIASGPLKPEVAAPILVGAFVFAADLIRALSREGLPLQTEFLWLRSYGMAEKPDAVTVLKAPSDAVRGRAVLLIDGVLDSGATLAKARELLEEAGAATVTVAVAVRKSHPRRTVSADFAMFEAGGEFLFGYGMDRAGAGREYPDIRVEKK
jgi:hypoxanthine phosphoribosyltransferase